MAKKNNIRPADNNNELLDNPQRFTQIINDPLDTGLEYAINLALQAEDPTAFASIADKIKEAEVARETQHNLSDFDKHRKTLTYVLGDKSLNEFRQKIATDHSTPQIPDPAGTGRITNPDYTNAHNLRTTAVTAADRTYIQSSMQELLNKKK
ncbi:MAG TPA: hypothetical protein PLQ36_01460, partial [Candidatus Gracilibacteria bacterium]|nr:hypothetical protein [Candidatus Gracilibacteria bacterium]